jgi:hypothetical protein
VFVRISVVHANVSSLNNIYNSFVCVKYFQSYLSIT